MLYAGLAQTRPKDPLVAGQVFSVSAHDLAALTGTKAISHYGPLVGAASRLEATQITLHPSPDGSHCACQAINLVREARHVLDEGRVEWEFNEEALAFLEQVRRHLTRVGAGTMMRLRTGWGMRLYDLALVWAGEADTACQEISPDGLRHLLGLDGKYRALDNLKRRVIAPAIEDVNRHSDLAITLSQARTGLRIGRLQFQIRTSSAMATQVDNNSGYTPFSQ